ncbi:P-selectin [Holothuria leucospilota]|uniref:p-selectin n=1 Tax=Holothuria leucospilota TaxID=206669 RepID=A0A9Q1BE15_HOLLE|nr:P-selectin [Holothuria leucospilota]
MVLSNHRQLASALLIAFMLSLEIRLSSSAARNRRESNGTLFAYCPPSRVVNATRLPKRVWWSPPEVHHRLVQSVRRMGLSPGSLFQEGRHTVIYEAHGFDGTNARCEIVFTINAVQMCQRVTPIPPTTMHCSNTNMAHSTCTFSCPSGYHLLGSSSVTCRTSGEWFGTFPICRPVRVQRCQNAIPIPPTNKLCTNDNMVHSTCTFSCPIGYQLLGSSSVTCETSGEWSDSFPICRRTAVQQCRNVTPILPTIMSCSNNNMVYSTCTFSCPSGYDLQGPSTVTCETSGEWSSHFPICRRRAVQQCRNVTPILPTIMSCSNNNMVHSSCTFSCPSGYDLQGPSTVTCETSGEWSSHFPICRGSAVQQCRNLTPILPTIMSCSNNNMVHSTCTFSCPSGYDLQGPSNVTCEISGGWSSHFPICTRTVQQCQNAIPIPPTIMRCSNTNMVHSTCSFTCPSGLDLLGSSSVTCRTSGEWSDTFPICRRSPMQQCQDVTPTPPTIMNCSNINMVDSTCTFSCPRGYRLLGSSTVTCRPSGEWSGAFPLCRQFTESHGSLFSRCPPPRAINATALLTRVWWSTPAINHHLVRSLRRIGPPPGSLFREGEHSVIYEARGFDGTMSRCEIVFTINVQQCQDVAPTRPTFMRCSNNNVFNSVCTFSCPRGYLLLGSPSVTCGSSGLWSETFPTCTLVVCDSLPIPDHSQMRCSIPNNRQGSWCEFRCFSGYKMVGSSVRTCLSDRWSGIQPICKDLRPPTFAFCPRLIRVSSEDGTASAKVDYLEPIALDSSTVNAELVSGQPSGERFAVGIHSIHYRAEDEAGNIADCVFNIQVYDNQPPHFDFCPKSVHAFSTTLSRAVSVTYRIPTATDNASPTSLNVSRVFGGASGSLFLPGVHAIHYRATDEAGNRAYCNFYIVVKMTPCHPLNEYEHLQMKCSEHLYQIGSWCRFTCNTGFVLSGSAIRLCEKTGWSGQEAICIADTTFTADVKESTSKQDRSTPTPPNQLVTSLSQMETEVASSISIEYEFEYYEEQTSVLEQTEANQIEIIP